MKPMMANNADDAVSTQGSTGRNEGRRKPHRRTDSQAGIGQVMGEMGTERVLTLEVAARDYIWLYDFRRGTSANEIAAREGVSFRQVRDGLERARAMEKKASKDDLIESLKVSRLDDLGFRLMPLFPIGAFTPQSACPHHDSLEQGSRLCCMVCHASGMDDHPGLQRDPLTDPSPEPMSASADVASPVKSGGSKKARKRRGRRVVEAAVA